MITETTADQQVTGTTTDGEQYTIARYGTTVVLNIEGHSDDTECPTEADAIAEFEDLREQFSAADLDYA